MKYYKLTEKDLEKCIDFAVRRYFAKKGNPNRTTGQARGLGAMINDWVGGKAIEIGVQKILEQFSNSKELELDFEVYNRIAQDPDIIKVAEKGATRSRDPNVYVEIKNYSENDRWLGLSMEQVNTIKKSKILNGDPEKAYIIYASLNDTTEDKEKRLDLLGAFLQVATREEYAKLFEKFVKLGDIFVKVNYVLSLKDLEDYGTIFKRGEKVYETNIFREVRKDIKNLEEIQIPNGIIPKLDYGGYPYPEKISDIKVDGVIKMYKKQNKKKTAFFVKADTECIVENKVLGTYNLAKGKIYRFEFGPIGRNPDIFRDVIWISANKAKGLFGGDLKLEEVVEKRLGEVAERI